MNSALSFPTTVHTVAVASARVAAQFFHNPSPSALLHTVVALNPLVTSFWLTLALIALQLLLSVFSRSLAWHDRARPFIPALHAVLFFVHPILSRHPDAALVLDARLSLVSALVLLCSARLFRDAAARGAYAPHGARDCPYRWLRLRYAPRSPLLFAAVYAVVVCGAFTAPLALVAMPAYFAWAAHNRAALSGLDGAAALLTACAIALGIAADRQQQAFQTAKRAATAVASSPPSSPPPPASAPLPSSCPPARATAPGAAEIADGFVQAGLFARCRHPGAVAEMAAWFSLHLFSVAAGGAWLNWSIAGPCLYAGQRALTAAVAERISMEQSPAYAGYRERVPSFMPLLFAARRAHAAEGAAGVRATARKKSE